MNANEKVNKHVRKFKKYIFNRKMINKKHQTVIAY